MKKLSVRGIGFLYASILANAIADPVLQASAAASNPPVRRLAVAWSDLQGESGYVDLMDVTAPWDFAGQPLETGRDTLLRVFGERIYAVSPAQDTIKSLTLEPWEVERTYNLPRGTEPEDIAVIDAQTAFVTGRRATHLLRLDLTTGDVEEAIDLKPFADADGIPDLGSMALHAGKLFVQVRRLNQDDFRGYVPPAYLAVVDVNGPVLVDVDPVLEGAQAITLAGTFPKRPMQIHRGMRRLFLSATGGFFDAGGIEMIDLDALRTMGLAVHESDGLTGADLGPFYLMEPARGYLVFTTDLTISSHLTGFSLLDGVSDVNLHTEVDFLAPVLAYDAAGDTLFFPSSGFADPGIHVFDASTGQRLNAEVVAAEGRPTDLAIIDGHTVPPMPAELEIDLHSCLVITGSTGEVYQIQYSMDLTGTNWMTLTNILVRESPMLWCDPTAARDRPRQFYRVVAPP